ADDRGPQDQLPRLQPPRRAGLRAERAADGGRLLHRRHDQRGGPLDSDRSLSVPAFGGAQGGHGALSRAAARGPAVEDRPDTDRPFVAVLDMAELPRAAQDLARGDGADPAARRALVSG